EQVNKRQLITPSRLFIYKVTRNLLAQPADAGAYLRTTIQSLVHFGVPPEQFWPYDESQVNVEPLSYTYTFAANYKVLAYYRYDPEGISSETLLTRIKANLNAGLPAAFGFFFSASIGAALETGKIPYPANSEDLVGGHAVVAAGYDDAIQVKNK